MRMKNKTVLWTTYFDSTKTRNEGRRVPKKLAVSTPKVEELQRAAKRLGLQPEVVDEATHPSCPWKQTGLLVLPKTEPKNEVMKKIGKELTSLRR